MKRIFFSFLLLGAAFIVKAQTADEIIAKHVEAIGGADAWRKVQSTKYEGNVKVQGADVSVMLTTLNGKGSRQDISLMGMNGFRIVTPAAGWNYMPFQGQTEVDPMTAEDLKEAQDDMDPQGKLVDYKEKGTTVELFGKDDVDGTECYKIVATTKSGVKETFFIDPKTSFVIKSIAVLKANGQEVEQASMYSNYTKLPEGIVVAMSIMLPFGEMNITKVEVNPVVDEGIFKPAK